jgi:hypothetical protein
VEFCIPQAKLFPTLIFQFVEDIQNAELNWKWNWKRQKKNNKNSIELRTLF